MTTGSDRFPNTILESGSNANGYYTKYSDGTLICRHNIVLVGNGATASFSGTWTYPHEFYVSTNNRRTGAMEIQKFMSTFAEYQASPSDETIGSGYRLTETSLRSESNAAAQANYSAVFIGALANNRTADLNLVAIGRWKA